MKNRKVYIALGIISLVFVGLVIIIGMNGDIKESEALRLSDLKRLSLTEKVARLEDHLDEKDITFAAIFGDRLVYGNEQEEVMLELPDDEFYLSFAPYKEKTHPCANHNLITCRGELTNEKFHVVVKDLDGNIIKEGEYSTYNNGFAGIWLPKNLEGTITVTDGELTATTNIETYSTSNTCLTTLKLR